MREIQVDFATTLCDWDGFGVNYVETAQTRDYQAQPQEYGGFSLLSEADRQKILDLIFGDGGLWPGVVKMFLDPFHMDVFMLNEIRHNITMAKVNAVIMWACIQRQGGWVAIRTRAAPSRYLMVRAATASSRGTTFSSRSAGPGSRAWLWPGCGRMTPWSA